MRLDHEQFRLAEAMLPRAPVRTETSLLGECGPAWQRAWDSLAEHASEPNPFLERWFLEPSIRHLHPGPGARMIAVWSDEEDRGPELLGLLPVGIECLYGRAPVRHVENWRHDQSFLGTPLVRGGRETAFWSAVLAALDAAPWAPGFLHITALAEGGPVHRGLIEAAAALGRPCDVVQHRERAFLASDLTPEAYYESAVRGKKRKDLRRRSARLAELGKVTVSSLRSEADVSGWCEDFLALEASGWKGRRGTALAADAGTLAFFRELFRSSFAAGRLEAIRMDLDEAPLAIIINFLTPPGSFAFKIAMDEAYAKYAPGVLIEIENLQILARPDIAWMDSCAAPDNAVINNLWRERRSIIRVTVPLSGWKRRALFRTCRLAEDVCARLRGTKGR